MKLHANGKDQFASRITMKAPAVGALAFLLLLSAGGAEGGAVGARTKTPRTITQIVTLLQDMMAKIEEDGKAERVQYAKFKCYCDTNKKEKTDTSETSAEQIATLSAEIDKLVAESTGLATEVSSLATQMAANVKARADAEAVRTASNAAFVLVETEMQTGIEEMDEAIKVLEAMGADQALLAANAGQVQHKAGHQSSMIKLQSQVANAMRAVSGLLDDKQQKLMQSFLQADNARSFSGRNTAVIVSILKKMKETFATNLADAQTSEANELEAYNKFKLAKENEHAALAQSHATKMSTLGSNEQDIASKKGLLDTATTTKTEADDFLAQLGTLCKTKAGQYASRKMMRANEHAAIAEAVAILNSDSAFENFGKVSATYDGATSAASLAQKSVSFLQVGSGRVFGDARRRQMQALLQHASPRLAVLAKKLGKATGPETFAALIAEIDKMMGVIDEEAAADTTNKGWCEDERTTQDAALVTRQSNIDAEEAKIVAADDAINEPTTGLLAVIADLETVIKTNLENQETAKTTRAEENALFLKDKAECEEAEATLKKAIKVLKDYYDKLAAHNTAVSSLVQQKKAAPEDTITTFGATYEKHSQATEAVTMLEFVLEETEKEREQRITDENTAQGEFETAMSAFATELTNKQGELATAKENLAEEQKKLMEAKQAKKDEESAKAAIEAYLAKIKPGCDFIADNFAKREASRADEKAALEEVKGFIQGSPAYTS